MDQDGVVEREMKFWVSTRPEQNCSFESLKKVAGVSWPRGNAKKSVGTPRNLVKL